PISAARATPFLARPPRQPAPGSHAARRARTSPSWATGGWPAGPRPGLRGPPRRAERFAQEAARRPVSNRGSGALGPPRLDQPPGGPIESSHTSAGWEAGLASPSTPECADSSRRGSIDASVSEEKGDSIMRVRLVPLGLLSLVPLLLLAVFAVSVPAQQAQAPIQIAWAGPLTGDVAQLGQGYLNGVKLSFEEWNAKGGVLGRK